MRNPNESEAAREDRHRREWVGEAEYRSKSHERDLKELKAQMEKLKQETPDPLNWQLMDVKEVGRFTALKVQYSIKLHNGLKILVYRASFKDLMKQKHLDPHFGDEASVSKLNYHYPIARFEPTENGWVDACAYASMSSARENC